MIIIIYTKYVLSRTQFVTLLVDDTCNQETLASINMQQSFPLGVVYLQ